MSWAYFDELDGPEIAVNLRQLICVTPGQVPGVPCCQLQYDGGHAVTVRGDFEAVMDVIHNAEARGTQPMLEVAETLKEALFRYVQAGASR